MKAADTPVDGIEIDNADERVFLLEGYLFPDTYDFYIGEDAQNVVKRFIKKLPAGWMQTWQKGKKGR